MSDSLQPHVPHPPMVFSRQEYWSGLTFVPPGDLPDPGIKPKSPVSPALQADSLPTEPSEKPIRNDWRRAISVFLPVLEFPKPDLL